MKYLSSTATEAEKKELRMFIKTTKDLHGRDRARAILKRMEGSSREEIGRFLEVNRDTVSNWITWYRKYGLEGIKSKWKGGNRHSLTYEQKEAVKQIVKTKTPKEVGISGMFWDIGVLKRYVKETYRVEYRSRRSYHRLFAFIGFTYHKPVKVDRKRSEEAVKKFEERLGKKGELIKRMLWS